MSNVRLLLLIFALNFVALGGRWNLPLAAWVTPVLVLHFYRRSGRWGRDFVLLWLATAIPLAVSWSGATFFPRLGEIGFFFAVSPIALLAVVVDRACHRRSPGSAWTLLAFPVAATALDYLQAGSSPFGTFGASAYSQRGFPIAMQLAAVGGIWGITFLMSLFASTVNAFWEGHASPPAWTAAGLLALALALSLGRLLLPTPPRQTAVVAGFSLPEGTLSEVIGLYRKGDEAAFRRRSDALHQAQLEQVRALAQDGADVVVLQEGAVMGSTDQIQTMLRNAGALAKEEGIYLVLPTFDFAQSPPVNALRVIDAKGDVVLDHIKYGGNQFEGTRKGDGSLQSIETPFGTLSAVICWDADFPNIIRQTGAQGVDLLIVPSQDWYGVRDIHAAMASFRGVENGLTVFRQTGQGVSLVSDPYGKMLSRIDSFESPSGDFVSVQTLEVPIRSAKTLYTRLGDSLGKAALLGLSALLLGLWLTRKAG